MGWKGILRLLSITGLAFMLGSFMDVPVGPLAGAAVTWCIIVDRCEVSNWYKCCWPLVMEAPAGCDGPPLLKPKRATEDELFD